MPEIVEVEIYRRQAEVIVSRSVVGVVAPDHWYLKGATTERSLSAAVLNRKVRAVRRVGKVLLVDFDPDDSRDQLGAVLGLRFGMTGRLVVDGQASIEKLLYSTSVSRPRYRRFELIFERGRSLVMVDPRRLGGVELAPDERRLGPDAATITARRLGDALSLDPPRVWAGGCGRVHQKGLLSWDARDVQSHVHRKHGRLFL